MKRIAIIVSLAFVILLITGLSFIISANINKKANVEKKAQLQENNDVIDINLSKDDIPKLVEVIKVWKLVDEVKLGELEEVKLVKFLSQYEKLDRLKGEYWSKRNEKIEKLRRLLETDAPSGQIESLLIELDKLDSDYLVTEKQLKDSLNSELTVKQRAAFLILQNDQWKDIRKLVRNLEAISKLKERQMEQSSNVVSKK